MLLQGGFFVLFWAGSGLSYLGQESAQASTLLKEHYLNDYLLFNLKLALVSLALGIVFGLFIWFFLRGLGLKRCPLLAGLFAWGSISAVLLALAFIQGPQLFVEPYLSGGFAARILDLVYSHAGARPLQILLGLTLLPVLRGVWRTAGVGGVAGGLCLVAGLGWWLVGPVELHRQGRGGNVVLLLVDSLRSDRISGLGYRRPTTPEIDRRLKNATVFPNTYVPLPRTLPSVVSLLTGTWPQQHGIRSMFPRREELANIPESLPKQLKKAGYTTVAVADYAGEIFQDLPLGFDRVSAPDFDFRAIYRQRSLERQWLLLAWLNNRFGRLLLPELSLLPNNSDPEALVDRVLAEIDGLPEPLFLTVFLSAPHFPYTARYPHDRLFADPDYRGPYRFATPYFLPQSYQRSVADVAQVNALYDGAVHAADQALGRLLGQMEKAGLLKDSLVVLTGDHGENLFEPGAGLGHGDSFFGGLQSVRVPMMIWGAGGEMPPGVRREAVRSIDLAPTLLQLLKVQPLPEASGKSLVDSAGDRLVYSETGLWMDSSSTSTFADKRIDYPGILETAEIDFDHGDEVVLKARYRKKTLTARHRLLLDGPWSLLYLPTRSGIRYELYRVDEDPGMTRDLADAEPARLQHMRQRMRFFLEMEQGATIRRDYVVFAN